MQVYKTQQRSGPVIEENRKRHKFSKWRSGAPCGDKGVIARRRRQDSTMAFQFRKVMESHELLSLSFGYCIQAVNMASSCDRKPQCAAILDLEPHKKKKTLKMQKSDLIVHLV